MLMALPSDGQGISRKYKSETWSRSMGPHEQMRCTIHVLGSNVFQAIWEGLAILRQGLVLREPEAGCRNRVKTYYMSFRSSGDH
jgi:hypothetical protein